MTSKANQLCHLIQFQPISNDQNAMDVANGISPVPKPPVTTIVAAAASDPIEIGKAPGSLRARLAKRKARFTK